MKFSVLLPTRNGGKFLANCIRSVLDQSYEDMELIVFDNANTDNTPNVIKTFSGDARLKSFRTEKPVSVTENWNNAFYACSGDYVLMIGDDDFLLPGYFKRMEEVLEQYDYPEGISYNGYCFIHAKAVGENPQSHYSHHPFHPYDFKRGGMLSPETLRSIVLDMFRFDVRVPLNTLPHLWSRKVISRVEGDIFRPPYPDHFALNSLLLKAKTWAFVPDRLYVLGVTPKSYGHFVFSDNEQKEAEDYLGISGDFPGQLPGNALVNNMYVWLNLLKEEHKDLLAGVSISRTHYVRHQVHYWISQYRHGSISLNVLLRLFGKLALTDWLGLVSVAWDKKSLKALWFMVSRSKATKVDTFYYGAKPLDGILSVKEFAAWVVSQETDKKRQSVGF